MAFVLHPATALRDVSPSADIGKAFGERIDIADGFINTVNLGFQPVRRDLATAQIGKEARQQGGMFGAGTATEIGHAADIPQQFHILRATDQIAGFGHVGQGFQGSQIIIVTRAGQPFIAGGGFKAADQAVCAAEFQPVIAPVQFLDGLKAVVFNGLDHVIIKGAGLARYTKRAVVIVAAGATGDLRKFVGKQRAHAAAIEFGGGGKGDVVDIEVEAHADGISGHQIINIAVLIQIDLRIARAG